MIYFSTILLSRPKNINKVTRGLPHLFLSKYTSTLYFLIMAIILSVYTNLMAIQTIKPKRTRSVPIQTIDDLAESLMSKRCRFVLPEATIGDEEFHGNLVNPVHNRSFAEKLRQAFAANPPKYVKTRDDMGRLVAKTDYNKKDSCFFGVDYLTMDTYYRYDWNYKTKECS